MGREPLEDYGWDRPWFGFLDNVRVWSTARGRGRKSKYNMLKAVAPDVPGRAALTSVAAHEGSCMLMAEHQSRAGRTGRGWCAARFERPYRARVAGGTARLCRGRLSGAGRNGRTCLRITRPRTWVLLVQGTGNVWGTAGVTVGNLLRSYSPDPGNGLGK